MNISSVSVVLIMRKLVNHLLLGCRSEGARYSGRVGIAELPLLFRLRSE